MRSFELHLGVEVLHLLFIVGVRVEISTLLNTLNEAEVDCFINKGLFDINFAAASEFSLLLEAKVSYICYGNVLFHKTLS